MITSIYIHIPFCEHICSYCDFSKVFYQKELVDKYLESLKNEISQIPKDHWYQTIYIGGGTPSSLNMDQLTKLFSLLADINLAKNYEFTIECNIENITTEKLKLFKKNRVNRLSIGVESFNNAKLTFLERNYHYDDIKPKIKLAKKLGFQNINIDLMYALPGETLNDMKEELNQFLSLNINHVSIYSLIIEDHTKLGIQQLKPIDEELDRQMYDLINQELIKHGYIHYEISNFCLPGYQSQHNITYWRNQPYYGLGLGASGYIGKIRYTNTKSINRYLEGKYRHEETYINSVQDRENEIMLGFRTIEGISKIKFKEKFKKNLEEFYNIDWLLKKQILISDPEKYYIHPKYWYILNEILVKFIGE
ncbi:MAG: radical SAM family heme chaperone HemW [bacterium]|nr:radical SAM family heme chaperone HemW [bacterium]